MTFMTKVRLTGYGVRHFACVTVT